MNPQDSEYLADLERRAQLAVLQAQQASDASGTPGENDGMVVPYVDSLECIGSSPVAGTPSLEDVDDARDANGGFETDADYPGT